MKTTIVKFLSSLRLKLFVCHRDWEIFNRLLAHTQGEKACGYPFDTMEQMRAQTQAHDAQALLDLLESQVQQMPQGYGEAFRYLMRRDICNRIEMHLNVAQKRIPPSARLAAFM